MKTKTKLEKLAEARRLLAGEEPDEFKVIYWNSDSGEPKPPAPAPGKGLLVIFDDARFDTMQKIVDEGRAMEAEKLAAEHTKPDPLPEITAEPEQVEPDPLPDIAPDPEPVPEPETTLFKQPSEAEIYLQRRAARIQNTHF